MVKEKEKRKARLELLSFILHCRDSAAKLLTVGWPAIANSRRSQAEQDTNVHVLAAAVSDSMVALATN